MGRVKVSCWQWLQEALEAALQPFGTVKEQEAGGAAPCMLRELCSSAARSLRGHAGGGGERAGEAGQEEDARWMGGGGQQVSTGVGRTGQEECKGR